MLYLGIDYGDKRIGLATISPDTGLSTPLDPLKSGGWARDIPKIVRIIQERDITGIVIGLPLNMDGSEGRRAEVTRKFGALLADASGLQIIYHDERLTSREADSILAQNGLNRQKRQLIIDSVCAQLILESYFAQTSNGA